MGSVDSLASSLVGELGKVPITLVLLALFWYAVTFVFPALMALDGIRGAWRRAGGKRTVN